MHVGAAMSGGGETATRIHGTWGVRGGGRRLRLALFSRRPVHGDDTTPSTSSHIGGKVLWHVAYGTLPEKRMNDAGNGEEGDTPAVVEDSSTPAVVEDSSTPAVVEEGDSPVAVDEKAESEAEALPPAQDSPAPNDEAADEHGKDVLFTDGSEAQGRSRHKKERDMPPQTDESLAETTQEITNNDAWDASPARPEPARATTLPPPREPAGWNRSVPMQNMSPPPAQFVSQYLPSQQAPNVHVSPIRRSPPRYYGSMYSYTSPTASRYSTLLHEGGQGKNEGAGQSDVEAYQEQRLISQELAKLRAEVTALKEEVTRQKTKRREVKAQLNASKQKQLEIQTEAKKAHTDDRAIRRELSKMKDIASERRSQIDALQEKFSASQAELREVQSKVWGLEKETAAQKRVATNAQHKLETAQKRLEEVRTENQKLSKENELLLDERDEYKNQSEIFQHELERAGALEAEMRKEAEVQREKVTRLTVEAETLESTRSNSSPGAKEDGGSSSLGDMAALLDEQRCELELTKQRLEEEEARSRSRKEKASVSKGKLEQVRSELAVAERERQALLAREASSAHYIKQIERDLANFEHQCAVMNDAVMTCQSREESHVREVNRLRTEADKAHLECEQYKEKMNMAEMKAANAESSRATAERQYDAERERLQKMTAKNERAEQQLSELHEQYQTHALTEARLKERNEMVSESLKQKEFEVDSKQRQLDMAMQTVERLQMELRQAALLAAGSTAPPPTMPALAAKVAPAAPEAHPRPAPSGSDKTSEEKAPVLPQKKRMNPSATANMKKALMAKKKMEQAMKRSSTPNSDEDGRGGGTASLAAMKAKLRTELTKQVQDAENRKTKKKDMDFLGLGYDSKKPKKRAPSSHASSSADEGDDR